MFKACSSGASPANMVRRSKRSASFITALIILKYISDFREKKIVNKGTETSCLYIFQGKLQSSLRGIILGYNSLLPTGSAGTDNLDFLIETEFYQSRLK